MPIVEPRQMELERIQAEIRSCRRCVVAGFIPEANPVFRGVAGLQAMVIGQAPAVQGHRRPAYAGPAGVKLRSWLQEAGFDTEDPLVDHFYLTSVTKCFPGPSKSGKGDRAPSPAEMRLCADHLEREVTFLRPRLIVTLGKLAGNAFVGPGSLTILVGGHYEREKWGVQYVAVPFPHPSGVSHWLNTAEGQAQLRLAIEVLGEERERLALGKTDRRIDG